VQDQSLEAAPAATKSSRTLSTTSRYSMSSGCASSKERLNVQVPFEFLTASGPPKSLHAQKGPVNRTEVASAHGFTVMSKETAP